MLFETMLKRRRIIIMSFFQQRLRRKRLLLQQKQKLAEQMFILESQVPRQLFVINMPRFRRFKSRNREGSHWQNLQLVQNRDMFFECFRMTHSSFKLLCENLRPHLNETPETLTPSLPVDKQIALCIYKLATCAEYRVVANVFGVSKCTVWKYFHCVIEALIKIRSDFISFPTSDEALQIAEEFRRIAHVPNIFGCIDGNVIWMF